MKQIVLFVLLLAPVVIAQEPAKPGDVIAELTPDERTAFDTVKAMESLASAKALETREGRAFQKARAVYEEKLKALQAAIQTTAEFKAAQTLRQKLDARVKARGAGVINWNTGALAPSPPLTKR